MNDVTDAAPACALAPERLTALHDGELSETAAADLRAHLAECPACAARLAELQRLRTATAEWAAPEMNVADRVMHVLDTPSFEQQIGASDETLSPLRATESRQATESPAELMRRAQVRIERAREEAAPDTLAELLQEVRGLRDEVRAARQEIAGLKAEVAALRRQGAPTATVSRYVEVLPYAAPTDAPTPFG